MQKSIPRRWCHAESDNLLMGTATILAKLFTPYTVPYVLTLRMCHWKQVGANPRLKNNDVVPLKFARSATTPSFERVVHVDGEAKEGQECQGQSRKETPIHNGKFTVRNCCLPQSKGNGNEDRKQTKRPVESGRKYQRFSGQTTSSKILQVIQHGQT